MHLLFSLERDDVETRAANSPMPARWKEGKAAGEEEEEMSEAQVPLVCMLTPV